MGVNVRIDMRQFTGRLRYFARDKAIRSVSEPGVKTQIYTELYMMTKNSIPVDTGALRDSPLMFGKTVSYGTSSKNRYKHFEHFAHGDITDEGIKFDPYSVNSRGTIAHYASSVKEFKPYMFINDTKELAYSKIAEILVKEMNNGQK